MSFKLKLIVIKDGAVDSVIVTEDGHKIEYGYLAGVRDTLNSRRCPLTCLAAAEIFIDSLGDLIAYDKSSAISHLTKDSNGEITDSYHF